MKAQFFFLIAAIALAMTSCQDDGLTDVVSPGIQDNQALTVTGSGYDPISTLPFDFNEDVFLTTRIINASETRDLNRVIRPHIWKIEGYGDSEIENTGSWYVDVDLQYNSQNDAISGTLKFTFPDYGDMVTLIAYGGPVMEHVNRGDDQLNMKLAIVSGTGRFTKVKFDGGGSIVLTSAWKDNGTMETKLRVDGTFIDNGE